MAALREKRLFLLDMDGTIYLDDRLFDGVIPFLQYIRRVGGRYLFLTNNSSRGVEGYIEKMRRLGIETERSDYLTSVDVTIAALQREPDVDILLCGFDRELTFQKLEDACILLNRGAEFWATNPDWVCPTWYGSVPDCGSVCRMLTTATGREPTFIGKPQPEMARLSLAEMPAPPVSFSPVPVELPPMAFSMMVPARISMVLPRMPLPPEALPTPPCAVPMVPPEMVSLPSLWMPSPA